MIDVSKTIQRINEISYFLEKMSQIIISITEFVENCSYLEGL